MLRAFTNIDWRNYRCNFVNFYVYVFYGEQIPSEYFMTYWHKILRNIHGVLYTVTDKCCSLCLLKKLLQILKELILKTIIVKE